MTRKIWANHSHNGVTMGLLDRLFGKKNDRQEFAEIFIRALKDAGDPRDASLDAEQFRLVFQREGVEQGVLNLANLFAEYQQVDTGQRKQCLSNMVRAALSHLKEMPDVFEEASFDIRPRIWTRSTFEQIRLSQLIEGGAESDWPHESIGEHLLLSLVYDLPESVRSLSNEDFVNWGVSYGDAREVAFDNLREIDFVVTSVGNELYASNTRDSYDATRIVFSELIHQLEITGRPLAMIPNRDTLLITGTGSQVGQKMMLEFAEDQLENQPRPMIATPLILSEAGEWIDWTPPENHVLAERYRRMKLSWLNAEYAEQKKLLESLLASLGKDQFVASYSVVGNEDAQLLSYAVWSQGVVTLLPETDLIILMRDPDGEQQSKAVRFSEARESLGHLFVETDHYPTRYLVSDFPSCQEYEDLTEFSV